MASRHVLAALVLAGATACAACSSSSSHHELDPYLCAQQDVGDNYQQLIEGDVSPKDLADLGSNPASRARAFRDAGLERGRFALFKQALPKPPFDPQVNVVCQVLEFDTPAAAEEWVGNLPADGSLAAIVMARLPDDHRTVQESAALNVSNSRLPGRLFTIGAGDGSERISALYSATYQGRVVFTLMIGRTADSTGIEESRLLGRILELRSQRTSTLANLKFLAP